MTPKPPTNWREMLDCPCVMGCEAELTVLKADGASATPGATARSAATLVREVARLVPALADDEGGIFTPAGRLYVDGAYLEVATAECASPWETVATLRTLERLVESARRRLWNRHRTVTGVCRANVHAVVGTTAGIHDNFAVADSIDSPATLMPHVASQVVYSGAGGLDPLHPGIVPILSPRRRLLLRRETVPGSRRLVHLREPHATSTLRIHVTGGEQLCFERGAVLRLGTTALLLKLLEHGKRLTRRPMLVSPDRAIDGFARSLRYRARLLSGGSASAVEIQRVYLNAVAKHVHAPFMPDWAEPLIELWDETLRALETQHRHAPEPPWFDWQAKARLFRAYLNAMGFDREKVGLWNNVLTALVQAGTHIRCEPADDEYLVTLARRCLRGGHPQRVRARRLLRRHQLELRDLRNFLGLRRRLLELELRFCLLGPGGLAWRVPPHPMQNPYAGLPVLDSLRIASVGPVVPRAQVRAELIQEHAHTGNAWQCNWDHAGSRSAHRRIALAEVTSLEPTRHAGRR